MYFVEDREEALGRFADMQRKRQVRARGARVLGAVAKGGLRALARDWRRRVDCEEEEPEGLAGFEVR